MTMPTPSTLLRLCAACLFLAPPLVGLWPALATAHGAVQDGQVPAPVVMQVAGPLGPPPPGVQDLKFSDFFQQPVGPRGLVPSPRLLSLDGQAVRLVGYMASQAQALPGRLVLAAMPVVLGDEDEPLADDLPPATVFVHLAPDAAQVRLPNLAGLLQVQGRLSVGPRAEPDGHVSLVRLMLDGAASMPLAVLATDPVPATGR